MTKATFVTTMLASTALIAAGTMAVSAQAPLAHRDGMPAEQFKQAQELRNSLGADDDASRGVYFKGTEWPPNYEKIKVCFFGGSKQLRAKIADVASQWVEANNSIKLDFGKSKNRSCKTNGSGPEMQIRIGFSDPGYWSYVGVESVVYRSQAQSSMNFEGFADIPFDQLVNNDYAIGTIRHEFGHALGLQHEHQNPKSTCNADFDWDKIYKLLGEGENGWPKEQVDFNMRPLSGDGLVATTFNKLSVMLYSFPAQFYVNGDKSECYIPHDNNDISQGDREVLAGIYPADPNARLQRFQATKAEFSAMLDKQAEEGTRSVTVNAMKEFFGRPGNTGEADDEE
jgi:hypothetical protein